MTSYTHFVSTDLFDDPIVIIVFYASNFCGWHRRFDFPGPDLWINATTITLRRTYYSMTQVSRVWGLLWYFCIHIRCRQGITMCILSCITSEQPSAMPSDDDEKTKKKFFDTVFKSNASLKYTELILYKVYPTMGCRHENILKKKSIFFGFYHQHLLSRYGNQPSPNTDLKIPKNHTLAAAYCYENFTRDHCTWRK